MYLTLLSLFHTKSASVNVIYHHVFVKQVVAYMVMCIVSAVGSFLHMQKSIGHTMDATLTYAQLCDEYTPGESNSTAPVINWEKCYFVNVS